MLGVETITRRHLPRVSKAEGQPIQRAVSLFCPHIEFTGTRQLDVKKAIAQYIVYFRKMISDAPLQELADSPKLLQNELLGFRRSVFVEDLGLPLAWLLGHLGPAPHWGRLLFHKLLSYRLRIEITALAIPMDAVIEATATPNQLSYIQVRTGC